MIYNFQQPLFLLLALLVPILVWLRIKKGKKGNEGYIQYSNTKLLGNIKPNWRIYLNRSLFYLVVISFLLFIIALAGPRSGTSYQEIETRGVDIMLVLDISTSMRALDFEPKNRMETAKDVIARFIDDRPNDRLGLVIFSSGAFTQCPLTLDHALLQDLLSRIKIGMIEDGTAIGNALAVAVARIRESEAKSKIIILLTDGANNRGEITPLDAAKLAADNNIKVHTIGVGKKGLVPYPVDDPVFGKRVVQVEMLVDEDILKEIAKTTGGKYFKAQDSNSLKDIYANINKMEKTVMKPKYYINYKPLYFPFLAGGLLLLLLAVCLELFVIRKIP
ncbi:MAG: VWA domain-containing protein [Acidobacteria bacterium]|nr:VWA domain-containing protein [Acidobacteriota bacterium]